MVTAAAVRRTGLPLPCAPCRRTSRTNTPLPRMQRSRAATHFTGACTCYSLGTRSAAAVGSAGTARGPPGPAWDRNRSNTREAGSKSRRRRGGALPSPQRSPGVVSGAGGGESIPSWHGKPMRLQTHYCVTRMACDGLRQGFGRGAGARQASMPLQV